MKTARQLLGDNLRAIMRQRGLTLEDIADMATKAGRPISWATVQRAAAGKRIPRETQLTQIASVLNIPESRLFQDPEAKGPIDRQHTEISEARLRLIARVLAADDAKITQLAALLETQLPGAGLESAGGEQESG